MINKRINAEKDKIFELKYSVQLKTMDHQTAAEAGLSSSKKSIDLGLTSKMSLPTEKDLIMTKL